MSRRSVAASTLAAIYETRHTGLCISSIALPVSTPLFRFLIAHCRVAKHLAFSKIKVNMKCRTAVTKFEVVKI